jgi:hypothetical protein
MRLGLLSDLHCELAPPRQRSWINAYEPHRLGQRLERAVEIFAAEQPDVVLLLGDTAELAEREAFDFVFARVHRLQGPLIAAVAGNHDGGADTAALEGSAAAHDIRLLRGETVGICGASLVGLSIAPVAPGGSAFSADVPELTGQGAVTILASHFPMCSQEARLTAAGLPYSGDLENRGAIESLLGQQALPTVALSGHVHARCSSTAGPVLQLTVGALIEAPFDCTIVDVQTDDDVTVRRRAFTLGDAPRVNPVFAPADEEWRWSGDRWCDVH